MGKDGHLPRRKSWPRYYKSTQQQQWLWASPNIEYLLPPEHLPQLDLVNEVLNTLPSPETHHVLRSSIPILKTMLSSWIVTGQLALFAESSASCCIGAQSSLPLPCDFWSEIAKRPKETIGCFCLGLFVITVFIICAVIWWFYYLRNRQVWTHNDRHWGCFLTFLSCRLPPVVITGNEQDVETAREAQTSESFFKYSGRNVGC